MALARHLVSDFWALPRGTGTQTIRMSIAHHPRRLYDVPSATAKPAALVDAVLISLMAAAELALSKLDPVGTGLESLIRRWRPSAYDEPLTELRAAASEAIRQFADGWFTSPAVIFPRTPDLDEEILESSGGSRR